MSAQADKIRRALGLVYRRFWNQKIKDSLRDAAKALAELERERDELRAQLDEYERAPTVATVFDGIHGTSWEPYIRESEDVGLPPPGTELIARPAMKRKRK